MEAVKDKKLTDVVASLSGGIDGYTMANWLVRHNYRVYPVNIRYNKFQSREHLFAQRQVKIMQEKGYPVENLEIVNIRICSQHLRNKNYVLGRNLFFGALLGLIAGQKGIKNVAMSVNSEFYYSKPHNKVFVHACGDQDINFCETLDYLLYYTSRINLITPFAKMRKDEIIKLAKRYGLDERDTISCDEEKNGKPCLRCSGCYTRIANFLIAGYEDRQAKETDPEKYFKLKAKFVIGGKYLYYPLDDFILDDGIKLYGKKWVF